MSQKTPPKGSVKNPHVVKVDGIDYVALVAITIVPVKKGDRWDVSVTEPGKVILLSEEEGQRKTSLREVGLYPSTFGGFSKEDLKEEISRRIDEFFMDLEDKGEEG